jgi:ribonuclease P protein component
LRREIDLVFSQGKRIEGASLTVIVKRGDKPFPRLAITVPKRLGNSVQRNRWKRLIREAFRVNQDRIPKGVDIIVMPRHLPNRLKMQDISKELLGLICRS